MKKIVFAVLGFLLCLNIWAQDRNDAVVYIQSDKETPIYVKMEGQMMERYSKNYVILNGLASGPMNIEILFQQNQYPAQKFVLNVPPSAQRSLVLQKVNNQKFALYDLNYGIYLQEGNALTDDIDISRLPAVATNNSTTPEEKTEISVAKETNEETIPAFDNKTDKAAEKEARAEAKRLKKEQDRLAREQEAATVAQAGSKEPKAKKEKSLEQIIDDAPTLSRADRKRLAAEQQKAEEQDRFLNFEMDKKEKESKADGKRTGADRAKATSCAEAASEAEFNSFAGSVSVTDDEEQRLAAIRKNATKYCFSTEQVRLLAIGFESQSSRYEVTRALKPYVVDKDKFESLTILFNTNYLKERFKNEVVGK